MAFKFTSSLLILAAIAAVSVAEPARLRSRSSRFRLARQEEASPAPVDPAVDVAPTPASAPYPPAGVTPAIPFDLPTETETEAQPDLTYGPPDNTYGPPPAEPDNTYGPPPAEPDNTYGPPPADTAADLDQDQDLAPADADPASEPIPASLILARNGRLRLRGPASEKLRSAQIIRSKPVLVYTIQ
ncbi:hypothetical protein AWZ03_009499 [Drosophila navojoa]|uniref:DUF4794 domain-containing protein n=1 Tax=Drosophila navojoa TaxID=7232 RepID=A0A484B605_DRONA|nr:uncharacterized protein LOC108651566 [Drosophila navojoa]TDG44074.1 hypothetical protein AWZ03_009499 [Drosophila navojoa]